MKCCGRAWGRLLGAILTVWIAGARAVPASADTCVECHSNPELRVTNKKLFDYYQDWVKSVHNQEGVTCVDCHGGDPTAETIEKAHRGKEGQSVVASVQFSRIPATCGSCHTAIEEKYEQSLHFKKLMSDGGGQRGPNCVTCHGSLNSVAADVGTVAGVCGQCHNQETGNHPDIPRRAERLLRKMMTIQRFHRYVAVRGSEEQLKRLRTDIEPRLQALSVEWHAFDLAHSADLTERLLDDLHAERQKILDRIRRRKDDTSQESQPGSDSD